MIIGVINLDQGKKEGNSLQNLEMDINQPNLAFHHQHLNRHQQVHLYKKIKPVEQPEKEKDICH